MTEEKPSINEIWGDRGDKGDKYGKHIYNNKLLVRKLSPPKRNNRVTGVTIVSNKGKTHALNGHYQNKGATQNASQID